MRMTRGILSQVIFRSGDFVAGNFPVWVCCRGGFAIGDFVAGDFALESRIYIHSQSLISGLFGFPYHYSRICHAFGLPSCIITLAYWSRLLPLFTMTVDSNGGRFFWSSLILLSIFLNGFSMLNWYDQLSFWNAIFIVFSICIELSFFRSLSIFFTCTPQFPLEAEPNSRAVAEIFAPILILNFASNWPSFQFYKFPLALDFYPLYSIQVALNISNKAFIPALV